MTLILRVILVMLATWVAYLAVLGAVWMWVWVRESLRWRRVGRL